MLLPVNILIDSCPSFNEREFPGFVVMFPFKPLGVLRPCHGKRILLWDGAYLGEADREPAKRGSKLV